MKTYPPIQWTTSVFYPSGYHDAVVAGDLALYFQWIVDFTLFYKKPLNGVDKLSDEKLMRFKAARSLFAHIDKFEIHGLGTHHITESDHVFWPPVYPTRKNIRQGYVFEGPGPEGLSIQYIHYVKFNPNPEHGSAFSFDVEGALHSDFVADLHELARRAACGCAANPFLTNRIFKTFGGYFTGNKCLGMLVSVTADFHERSAACDTGGDENVGPL